MSEQKIILASITAGQEEAVATALGSVLDVATDMALSIVGSAPVILLAGLDSDQAAAVAEVMAPIKAAGGNIAISAASGVMGEINWPTPPNVAGRPLESFKAGYVAPAPAPEPTPVAAPGPAPGPAPASAAGGNALVPTSMECPHCGGHIVVSLAPAPTPAPAAAPTPTPTPAPASSGAMPAVTAVPTSTPLPVSTPVPLRTGPMDLEEFEQGVGGGSDAAMAAVSDEIVIDEVAPEELLIEDDPARDPAAETARGRTRRTSLRGRRRRR